MLRTADRYYAESAKLARRAVRQAKAAKSRGPAAVALVVAQHQATEANEVSAATTAMLAEQGLRSAPVAPLNPLAFTSPESAVLSMLDQIEVDWQFNRLVASLVQDAGRAAQGVSITSRTGVQHVRHLNPPSCSRCVVLAGRVYRFSEGFDRHPGDDCVMIPVTVASPDLTYDPAQMARDGLVSGLSKTDMKALNDGADFNQVVNVRKQSAGLTQAGQVLARRGRPTPAAIYAQAGDNRERAIDLLTQAGYLRS